MVPPFDYLDSMSWSIAASGILVGIAAFRLKYNPSTDAFEEENRNVGKGLGIALGITAFYLFLTGISISFGWHFSGAYNVLFGGAASLAGLVLLTTAIAFYFGRGFQAATYFGFIVGLYLLVDAIAIYSTINSTTSKLTSDPMKSTLLYLAPAAVLLYSPIAAHIKSKYARWVFGVLAFLLGIAWLYFAYTTTLSHLGAFPST
ncbi:MAG TPA: DUF981 family protein [Candidatus Bathyarchaeia archaeon]|nr:DUF981 family protein [Candidatus Bathyarchaeia archaeon]